MKQKFLVGLLALKAGQCLYSLLLVITLAHPSLASNLTGHSVCVTTEQLAKPRAHVPASPPTPTAFTCFAGLRDCSHLAFISPHHHQPHLPPQKMQTALSLLCFRADTCKTWLMAMLFHREIFMGEYA